MARQFVYFMQGLTKAYPTRKVLDNVHLSFYPDAKIGVLGVNGAGKSTLLRIMAGIDKDYTGEAWVAEGATVGLDPVLDRAQEFPLPVRQLHARPVGGATGPAQRIERCAPGLGPRVGRGLLHTPPIAER